jgi:hypothetical protein
MLNNDYILTMLAKIESFSQLLISTSLKFNPFMSVGRTKDSCNLRIISVFVTAKHPLRCFETLLKIVVKEM